MGLVFFLASCASVSSDKIAGLPPTEQVVPTLTDISPTATETLLPTETAIIPTEVQTAQPSATAILPPTPTAVALPDTPGIILFIGDGMGRNHRLAAAWAASGENGLLVMDNMPVHGMANTAAADRAVTDSAAAATAFSAGVQTNYQTVGIDPDGHAVKTILEYAQEYGWATGLVTTVQLSHATPAAFASHVPNRNSMVLIAQQMMEHKINVLLGGGENVFSGVYADGCYPGRGYQSDYLDLVEEAVDFGYTYTCSPEEFAALDLSGVTYLFGLFGAEEMARPFQPSLQDMTRAAIEVLSQDEDGFFLMVEAGQIDWAAHENEAEETITSTLGLDAAVSQAKSFALERPNTLIIVAADHETGGMRLNRDGVGSYLLEGPFEMPDGSEFWVDWSSGSHTDEPVSVTAQGPYAELLSGEYHLTRIFDTMFLMLFSESQ